MVKNKLGNNLLHFAAVKKNHEMYNYLLANTKINQFDQNNNGVSAKEMIEKKIEKKVKIMI